MKTCWILILVVCLGIASSLQAASVPGTLSSQYMTDADWLEKATFGVDAQVENRLVKPTGGLEFELDVMSASAFLGYDVARAVTMFVTLGAAEDETFVTTGADDTSLRWGVGVNFNLSAYDIRHPGLMAGDRVNIKLLTEISGVDTDFIEWFEYAAALPITYEIIEEGSFADARDRYAVGLYVGPVVSILDGKFTEGGVKRSFDESQAFGLMAGLDIYFTRNLSMGATARAFDEDGNVFSGGGSLRYHF